MGMAAMCMGALKSDVLLETEQADGSFRSRSFCGVPASRASRIAIVSSGSAQGRAWVTELAGELEAVLLASSPEVQSADVVPGDDPSRMHPAADSGQRKLLVLVGSRDAKFHDLPWYSAWQSDDYDAAVMTVVPPGSFHDLLDNAILSQDNHLLRRVNAAAWQKRIGEVLPAVLARAEVTSAVSRVFLSYRRLETLPVALQLFDRLVHEGFDVFLDRFSIPPGYDFQRRLNQELEDKAMVVLLESKSLKDSKWTQHEIDFAKRYRLGLVSLRMPDVKDADVIASLQSKPFVRLENEDFTGPAVPKLGPDDSKKERMVPEWPRLTKEAENRVTALIKTAHADALFARRHRLRKDVVAALANEELNPIYQGSGPITVPCSHGEHLIWLTTRPPEVDDLHSVHTAIAARARLIPTARGLIVGPQAALEPDRRQRLDWRLHQVSNCLSFDEGNLPDFARRVKNGQWR